MCCWSSCCPRTLQVYGSGEGSDEKPLILSTQPLCKQRGASCGTFGLVGIYCLSAVPCKAVLWTPRCLVSSWDEPHRGDVSSGFNHIVWWQKWWRSLWHVPCDQFWSKLIARSPRSEQEEEELSHLVMLLRVWLSERASISECTCWICVF